MKPYRQQSFFQIETTRELIDKPYSHCIICGYLYEKGWGRKLVHIGVPITKEYNDYRFSSGICEENGCMNKLEKSLNEKGLTLKMRENK